MDLVPSGRNLIVMKKKKRGEITSLMKVMLMTLINLFETWLMMNSERRKRRRVKRHSPLEIKEVTLLELVGKVRLREIG